MVLSIFIVWMLYALSYAVPLLSGVGCIYLYRKGRKTVGRLGCLVAILFLIFNPVPNFLNKPIERPQGSINVNLENPTDFSWKDDIDFGRFFDGKNAFFAATGNIDISIDLPGLNTISEPTRSISIDYNDKRTKSVDFYLRDRFSDEEALKLLRDYNSRFGPIIGGEARLLEFEYWILGKSIGTSMTDTRGFEKIARFQGDTFQVSLSIRNPSTKSFDGPLKTVEHIRMRIIQIRVKLEPVARFNSVTAPPSLRDTALRPGKENQKTKATQTYF